MDTFTLPDPSTQSLKGIAKLIRDDVICYPEKVDTGASEALTELTTQKENYLLEFFGSVENAMSFGHLFVVEETPLEITTDVDLMGDTYVLIAEQRIRIRPKTAEELEAEKSSVGFPDETIPPSR